VIAVPLIAAGIALAISIVGYERWTYSALAPMRPGV